MENQLRPSYYYNNHQLPPTVDGATALPQPHSEHTSSLASMPTLTSAHTQFSQHLQAPASYPTSTGSTLHVAPNTSHGATTVAAGAAGAAIASRTGSTLAQHHRATTLVTSLHSPTSGIPIVPAQGKQMQTLASTAPPHSSSIPFVPTFSPATGLVSTTMTTNGSEQMANRNQDVISSSSLSLSSTAAMNIVVATTTSTDGKEQNLSSIVINTGEKYKSTANAIPHLFQSRIHSPSIETAIIAAEPDTSKRSSSQDLPLPAPITQSKILDSMVNTSNMVDLHDQAKASDSKTYNDHSVNIIRQKSKSRTGESNLDKTKDDIGWNPKAIEKQDELYMNNNTSVSIPKKSQKSLVANKSGTMDVNISIGAEVKLGSKKLKRQRTASTEKFNSTLLFRDCFQVEIPLGITADLSQAVQRSRAKRISTIYKHFPELLKNNNVKPGALEADDDEKNSESCKPAKVGDPSMKISKKQKTLPKLKHVPQPSEYATVLDYLEAKYVQGIMVNENEGTLNSSRKNFDTNLNEDDDDDEGGGSVYSESSFLDDSGLKRTIVEQVLGQATTTKLELLEDDNDFFVNVGPLEVQETELTNTDYDPTSDATSGKNSKNQNLRKRSSSGTSVNKAVVSAPALENSKRNTGSKAGKNPAKSGEGTSLDIKRNKKKKIGDDKKIVLKEKKNLDGKTSYLEERSTPDAPEDLPDKKKNKAASSGGSAISSNHSDAPRKKKQKLDDDEQSKKAAITGSKVSKSKISADKSTLSDSKILASNTQPTRTGKKPLSEDSKLLLKKVSICKKKLDEMLKKIADYVKAASNDELPRRPQKTVVKKLRVELKCPPDKKTGDMITFSNPHVPGQKLRVKIPANRSPKGVFKVTVPVTTEVPAEQDPETEGGPDPVDHNRISRTFYDILEEYARRFDEWCDAEGEFRKSIGDIESFITHFEKRKKFDALVGLFPNDELKTPVDKPYLQKILRRARQNKHKRDKAVAGGRQSKEPSSQTRRNVDDSSRSSGGNEDDDIVDIGKRKHEDDGRQTKTKVKKTSSLMQQQPTTNKKASKIITIVVPQLSRIFPKLRLDRSNDGFLKGTL